MHLPNSTVFNSTVSDSTISHSRFSHSRFSDSTRAHSFKRYGRFVAALGFVLLLLAGVGGLSPALAQPDGASSQKHMLWEISRGGETEGFLVGSIHFMKPDVYPLPPAFDDAFEASDVMAFETNIDSVQAQAQSLIGRLGMYPGEKTLESELSDSTYTLLQTRADSLGLNLSQMRKLEPWVISIIIPATQMQKAGYSGQSGIDVHFFNRAKEAEKERVAFETVAEQLRFFDNFPADRQEAYLAYSLQDANQNVEMIDEMVAAWTKGDADRLEDLVQEEMRTGFPDLYETLIVDRNNDWMPQIKTLLDGDETPFIVVGAGHVTGEHGIVAMLRDSGYTVTQQ